MTKHRVSSTARRGTRLTPPSSPWGLSSRGLSPLWGNLHWIAWIWIVLFSVACTPSTETIEAPVSAEAETLTPPPFPSLEGMEPAVREQFEERSTLLDQVLANPDAADHDVAWALGQMGRLHQAYRHLEQARWCYAAAHARDPETFDWPYLHAHLDLVLGDPDSAKTLFERAHQLRPDVPGPLAALGRLALEAGDPETATEHYRAALALDETLPVARHGLALVELEQGHAADAVERLRRLLDEQPRAYQLHYAMADALRTLGRDDEARWHLDSIPASTTNRVGLRSRDPWLESIQTLPRSSTDIDRRGRLALVQGQTAEALRLFRQAESMAPDRREVQFNLATALVRIGQTDEAVERLQRMLEAFPDFSGAPRLLGRTLAQRGDLDGARTLLEQALELDPRAESNHRAMGDFQLAAGNPGRAIGSFETALELESRSAEAHVGLGLAHLLLGRPGEADQVFVRGLEVQPRSRPLQWLRLRSQSALGNPDLDTAQTLPSQPQTLFELETTAMFRAVEGNFDVAVRWQELAVERARTPEHRRLAEARLERYRAGRQLTRVWEPFERAQVASNRAGSPSRTR